MIETSPGVSKGVKFNSEQLNRFRGIVEDLRSDGAEVFVFTNPPFKRADVIKTFFRSSDPTIDSVLDQAAKKITDPH